MGRQAHPKDGTMLIRKIPGEDNPADLLTKSLPRGTHEKHTAFVLQDVVPA